jgi:hypothetical protein
VPSGDVQDDGVITASFNINKTAIKQETPHDLPITRGLVVAQETDRAASDASGCGA